MRKCSRNWPYSVPVPNEFNQIGERFPPFSGCAATHAHTPTMDEMRTAGLVSLRCSVVRVIGWFAKTWGSFIVLAGGSGSFGNDSMNNTIFLKNYYGLGKRELLKSSQLTSWCAEPPYFLYYYYVMITLVKISCCYVIRYVNAGRASLLLLLMNFDWFALILGPEK